MGKYYEELSEKLIDWIYQQHCFWVASAPLSQDGHVNVSPKGMQDGKIFHVVNNRACYYLDLTGSGNETISHIYENQRLTICFSAFTGPPQIVRLWGRAKVHERGSPAYSTLIPPGGDRERELNFPGLRAIIWLDIEQVGTSCGYSVPYYDFKEYRRTLETFAENLEKKATRTGKWEDGFDAYWAYKNQRSNDGLPGMKRAVEYAEEKKVKPMEKFVGVREVYGRVPGKAGTVDGRSMALIVFGIMLGVLLTQLLRFAKSANELYRWAGVQDMPQNWKTS